MAINTFGAVAGNWSDPTKWSLLAKPVAGDDVLFTVASANCAVDENTALLKSLDMTGYAGALSANYAILVGGLTASTQVCKLKGLGTWIGLLYLAPVTTTAVINFTSNGELLNALLLQTSDGSVVLQDNLSFVASKTSYLRVDRAGLNLNGFTISGNSATNRLLIYPPILGTPKIITVSGGTFANCDFRDISFANGGANLDLSAITGLSGDCGGNGMSGGGTLTMTTSRTCNFINAAGGNWADVANWDTAVDTDRVPLPQDDVTTATAFNSGVTITANSPRLGRSITFAGATATGAGVLPIFTLGNAVTNYGSLNLTGLKSGGISGDFAWNIESQARSGTNTITSNGKIFINQFYIYAVGTIVQLQDALQQSGYTFRIYNGYFDANDFNVTINVLNVYSGATVYMGDGTWTINYGQGTPFQIFSGATIYAENSTIVISDSGSLSKTFSGGSYTFNNLSITGGGTGAIIFTGANSFNGLPQITGGTKTLTFPSTVTTTFRGAGPMNFGNGTNIITLNASSVGTASTLAISAGAIVVADYLNITNINVTPAAVKNAYQTVSTSIASVANADKDAIDKIIFTPVDAYEANTVYIDNMRYK